ncbi:MAG: CotH kinase family protein [Lachnospiraceae bacterium]|nr:CotH kinase family protein [Lachnospiraceae bacterium]
MKRILILTIYSILLLIVSLMPVYILAYQPGLTGILVIDPSKGNILHIEEYGLDLPGIDKDGVTYFCLPAFINLVRIDMQDSPAKLYLKDGSVLNNAELWHVQDVLVDTGNEALVPWKIEFMKSANLNSVFLNFDDTEISSVDHDNYTHVSAKIYSPSGVLNYLDENALIKGRGNATWQTEYFEPEKKPYEISFSESIRIGNLYPKKKWCLLASTYEGTDVLNKMVLDTAKKMDIKYVSDSEWIDLYANGRYLGNYLVCSEPKDSASPVISSGGWLVEKNDVYYNKKPYGFITPHDSFTVKISGNVNNGADISGISAFVNYVDNSIRSESPDISDILDMDSFVRWFILEEFFYNEDALISSCYFYKPGNENVLYAGPPWDFDNVCGEAGKRFLNYEGSILNEPEHRQPLEWYGILYDDPVFRERVYKLFRQYIPVFSRLINSDLDDYYYQISSSAQMDRAIYGTSGYGQDYTVPGYYESVYDNFRYTRFFLCKRFNHLAEIWNAETALNVPDQGNGEEYIVSFIYPDGTEKHLKVSDGSLLDTSDCPLYDAETYKGWVNENNGIELSPFIPVFEDMRFILEESDQ